MSQISLFPNQKGLNISYIQSEYLKSCSLKNTKRLVLNHYFPNINSQYGYLSKSVRSGARSFMQVQWRCVHLLRTIKEDQEYVSKTISISSILGKHWPLVS